MLFCLFINERVIDAARLASLVNAAERALGFGASKRHVDNETEKAISSHMTAVGSDIRPDLQPSPDRQESLTQPLDALAIHLAL